MEVRTAGSSNNFARLSNDLIAYRASESDVEVNGSLSSYPRMHLSSYEGHNNYSHDVAPRAATMKYDRRYTSAGTGIGAGDSMRLRSQQGHEARNAAAAVSNNSASAYSSTSRRGQNTNRPPTGEVRTSCLVKSASGFGFTLADAPAGHMVKIMAEPLGPGQLQPGDIIVMIDGVDVRRQSHENTVAMLKSYPPGSTVIINYVRTNVDRNPHPRPHSAIPRSSLYSTSIPLQSWPMNGGGRAGDGTGGMGGMGGVGDQSTLDHRTTNHRMLTTHPEDHPSGLNGTSSSPTASSFHHSRTVSFDNSTDAGDATMNTGSSVINREETKGRRDSRRLKGILRRSITPRRSTPVHEAQKQHLMSTTSSISNLNFSGTPDFIPASLYRPSFSTGEYAELIEDQMLQADVAMVNAVDRSQTLRANNNAEAMHSFSSVGPSIASSKGQWSEASNNARRTSLLSESKSHETKTTKSFDNDNRLEQMTIGNHQQPLLYTSQSMHRSDKGRRDSGFRKHSGDVNLKGGSSLVESVDQSPVYNADIHRGSRGFGFSIRGGSEFNGMPLLVLDIAEGGPTDMDGRLKNGDQILSINGFSTRDMTHERAIELIQNACSPISLVMKRNASSAKRQSRPARVGDTVQTKHP